MDFSAEDFSVLGVGPTMTIFKSHYPDIDVPVQSIPDVLLAKIWEHSLENPTKKAFINASDPSDSVTYGQLFLRIHALAAFLDDLGFQQEDVAAVVAQNRWEFAAVLGGVLAVGGAVSGASVAFTDWELARQFNDCKACVVFCEESVLEKVLLAAKKATKIGTVIVIDGQVPSATAAPRLVSLRQVFRQRPQWSLPRIRWRPKRDVALIPYSSGTTGAPKGVLISHYNLLCMVAAFHYHNDTHINPYLGADFDPRTAYRLFLLPFYHAYGNGLLFAHLLKGGTAIVMDHFEPARFLQSVQDYRIRSLQIVPPIVVFLAKHPMVAQYDLSSVRQIASGAAPLGADLTEELRRRLPHIQHVFQGYGMTECTMASHMNRPADAVGAKVASIGRLVPNAVAKVVDTETGAPLGVGQRGEICVKSPTVMLGYLRRPHATANTIDPQGFLHTGDVGFVNEEGIFYIVDRLKELIKVKGLQVPPAELEDILLSHPRIADAAVIGVEDQAHGEIPKAFVVRHGADLTEEEVVKYVADKTAHYKHLKGGVEFVEVIPKSPSGKILRRELRDRKAKI